jgi:hypothetical protein
LLPKPNNYVFLIIDSINLRTVTADDVNLLGDIIDTIKKNTESLIDARKEVGLELNVGKTKYMLLSRHQNVGQNHQDHLKMYYSSSIWVDRNISKFDTGGN